jgi:hypothetical protein
MFLKLQYISRLLKSGGKEVQPYTNYNTPCKRPHNALALNHFYFALHTILQLTSQDNAYLLFFYGLLSK